jgi:anti-anti-sigma factor
MDLILEVRTGQDRATMACHGQLIEGQEAEAFRRSALLLLGGFDKLILNLAGVRSADRGGLSTLASLLELARDKGKQVRITHAGHLKAQILEVTGLAHLLEREPVAMPPVASREAFA